jgi:arabinogalactan endo-1,4-beta-galactosidase
MTKILLTSCVLAILALGCSKENLKKENAPDATVVNSLKATGFTKGVGNSWARQMYATGQIWKNSSGVATSLPTLFKTYGISAIEERVWVNPSSDKSNGHCSPAEVAAEAAVYYKAGYKICINFHYGDTWNSVGVQNPPAAWASYTYAQMKAAMVAHVQDVLNRCKSAGVTPTWMKNGNEINVGVCRPIGSVSNGSQMTGLLNACYDAAKVIFPNILVIIHVGQPQNTAAHTFWSTFSANGGKFDIMGFSSYGGGTNIPGVFSNMKSLQASYASTKPVIQVEFGGTATKTSTATDLQTWITNLKSLPNASTGGGVWYWEADCESSWNGYSMGAFDATTFMPASGILAVFGKN